MRWKFGLGLGLALLGAGMLLFTLLFPQGQSSAVNLTLANGVQVRITAKVSERGWVGDSNDYSLKVVSQPSSNVGTPLHFAARLQLGNVVMSPQGWITRNLNAGDAATYNWKVWASAPLQSAGVLWFAQTTDSGDQSVLYAKEFNFTAYNYWGLEPLLVRAGAGLVLLVGLLLLWLSGRKPKRQAGLAK